MTNIPYIDKVFAGKEEGMLTPQQAIEMLNSLNELWGLGVRFQQINETYELPTKDKLTVHAAYTYGNNALLIVTLDAPSYRERQGDPLSFPHRLLILKGKSLRDFLEGLKEAKSIEDAMKLAYEKPLLMALWCVTGILSLRFPHAAISVVVSDVEGRQIKMRADSKFEPILTDRGYIISKDDLWRLASLILYERARKALAYVVGRKL